jgi:hypothetical protein
MESLQDMEVIKFFNFFSKLIGSGIFNDLIHNGFIKLFINGV